MERRRGKGSTGARGVDFQEALRRFLASRHDGVNFHLTSLWRAWPKILGQELAALAMPLGAQERVLLVGAEDNPSLSELSFRVPFILNQANAFLRQDYFTGVRLELLQGRRPLGRYNPEPPEMI